MARLSKSNSSRSAVLNKQCLRPLESAGDMTMVDQATINVFGALKQDKAEDVACGKFTPLEIQSQSKLGGSSSNNGFSAGGFQKGGLTNQQYQYY